MKVRDLIARLVEFRDAGAVDDFGARADDTLERQAASRLGPDRAAAGTLLWRCSSSATRRSLPRLSPSM